MRTHRPHAAAVLLLALAACNILPYDQIGVDSSTMREPDQSLEARAAATEREVARIRGLESGAPTPVAERAKDELKTVLVGELDEEWTKGGPLAERAYKEFGLVPRDLDLKPWLVEFLADQIAGWYDPETGQFFTVAEEDGDAASGDGDDDDDDDDEKRARRTDWPRDFEETFVLAHELTHALDDRHFDLDARDEALAQDDDRALAWSAVVEGDAMDAGAEHSLWLTGFPASTGGPMLRSLIAVIGRRFDPEALDALEVDGDAEKRKQMEAFKDAPPVMKAELLFPYVNGYAFTNRARAERGWAAVDELLREPPESTEQVLYPERFYERLDRPRLVTLQGGAPAGLREVHRQTLGLVRIRALLRQLLGPGQGKDLDGWDGDRYVLWESEHGDVLGWVSAWDSEREARAFAARYEEALGLRYGADDRWRVRRAGQVVAAVQHAPPGRADEITEFLLGADVQLQDGDEGPDRWYWKLLRWPVTARPTRTAFEVKLIGDHALDWRATDVGHRFRLLDSLAIHSESNPDRMGFWLALGLVGFANDDRLNYSYARIPLAFTWHGRDEGEDRRSRFGLALNLIRHENVRGAKRFDLVWGGLLRVRYGEGSRDGKRLRVLFVPIPGV